MAYSEDPYKGKGRIRTAGEILPGGNQISDIRRGGMGIVYIVYNSEIQMDFAVKTFRNKYFTNNAAIERFKCEAKTWLKLKKHSNIVEAFFIQEIDNKPHLFLEYVDGPNLTQILKKGRFDQRHALDISLQLCEGMVYAYEKLHIVHRDLKSPNILLTSEGCVKITDFGLVRVVTESIELEDCDTHRYREFPSFETTTMGNGVGTPEYMAPEQWIGAFRVDTRTDIYAFGVMLYEMLCGRRPFELARGEPIYKLQAQHLKKVPTDPRELNSELNAGLSLLIMKCLEKEPSKRFQNFTELRDELQIIHQNLFDRPWTPRKHKPQRAPTCSQAMQLAIEGISMQSLEDHKKAIELFDKALSIEPRNVLALHMKARSYCLLGKHHDALKYYQQCEKLEPNNSSIHDGMAFCLNEMKQHDAALRHAERSIELEPREFSSWNNKAIALINLGRNQDATFSFEKALEYGMESAEVLNNYGFLHTLIGKSEEAVQYFKRAINLNPRYLKPYFNYSNILIERHAFKEAISLMEQVLSFEPDLQGAIEKRSALQQCIDLKTDNRRSKMLNIKKVEIYFEPLGATQMAIKSGAQVGIPLHEGIPAAVRTADQFLGMNGDLIEFTSDLSLKVQTTEEMSDADWASFIDSKAEGMRWKRWNAETTQGRWNVIVFLVP